MESEDELKSAERQETLHHWLSTECGLVSYSLLPMQGDASFRRYFRVVTSTSSFVAMDAPPTRENCRPYVAIARALREQGLNAPEIFHADVEQGYLLLTDYGDMTYLKALRADNADTLYQDALDALTILQTCRSVKNHALPDFSSDFMQKEWAWHKEWFLTKLLALSFAREEKQLNHCFDLIVESALAQPQVFMHRDYHSANLMVMPGGGTAILDFQDAFIGPVTYDVVSLLRDCYIDWPEARVEAWVTYYWQQLHQQGGLPGVELDQFLRWFDYMGLERHLKALFTFARKHVRDKQSQYLKHVPRTLHYLLQVSQRYPELTALHDYLHEKVQPAFSLEFACAP